MPMQSAKCKQREQSTKHIDLIFIPYDNISNIYAAVGFIYLSSKNIQESGTVLTTWGHVHWEQLTMHLKIAWKPVLPLYLAVNNRCFRSANRR